MHDEGSKDLYTYNKKTNTISLEENSMEDMSEKADYTLRKRTLERNRTIVALL